MIIIGFIALLALALSNFRYTTTRLSDSTAYQVDNWTGRAWVEGRTSKNTDFRAGRNWKTLKILTRYKNNSLCGVGFKTR